MIHFVRNALHQYDRHVNVEEYQRYQEIRRGAEIAAGVAQVMLIVGIFASVIGISVVATAASFLATIPGYFILGSGLGISYLSWNGNALGTNIAAIANRPRDYMTAGGMIGDRFDNDLLRNGLRRNTIGCDLVVDLLMQALREEQMVE